MIKLTSSSSLTNSDSNFYERPENLKIVKHKNSSTPL